MATEHTLCIIKPDAVGKNVTGQILARFEAAGLRVVAIKKVYLNAQTAGAFYAEHKERPFFGELVSFMISGPCYPVVLAGEGAIAKYRALMGATNPTKAEPGTLRYDFALPCTDLSANAVHGSDSPESAAREIGFFFGAAELN
jgi:nucleoside-diphosphate kinase